MGRGKKCQDNGGNRAFLRMLDAFIGNQGGHPSQREIEKFVTGFLKDKDKKHPVRFLVTYEENGVELGGNMQATWEQ